MINKVKDKILTEMCEILDKQPMTKDDICILGELADALKDISTAGGMDAYGVKYLDMDESFGVRIPHMNRAYMSGYSGHSINDRMIASLEKLMDAAESDYERKQIHDEIESLRQR